MDREQAAAQAARDLRIAVGRLHRRLRLVANEGALSASQTSALVRLAKGEADTAAGLAALEGVRPQSMAATVAALTEYGLVSRGPDPADGRRAILALTTEGRSRLAGDRAARQEWLAQRLLGTLDDEALAALQTAALEIQRLAEP